MEEAFIRPRNITFDRHVFLTKKQLREETVEHFYGKLKELAENCDFENKEETLIRDVFVTNLMDTEIQKELLKQAAAGVRTSNQYGTRDAESTSDTAAQQDRCSCKC